MDDLIALQFSPVKKASCAADESKRGVRELISDLVRDLEVSGVAVAPSYTICPPLTYTHTHATYTHPHTHSLSLLSSSITLLSFFCCEWTNISESGSL